MKEAELFKSIFVWHRVSSESAVLYECLESLSTHLFAVSVATAVRLPADGRITTPTSSFIERFIEHDEASAEKGERTQWFATLQEAIEAHRQDFDDEYFAAAIPGYRKDFGYD